MNSTQKMIEQLGSHNEAHRLEAIEELKETPEVEVLSALLEVMMDPAETVNINLEKSKHPKVEAYHAAISIATEEMLKISLVDRKRPLTRAGAAFLFGRIE